MEVSELLYAVEVCELKWCKSCMLEKPMVRYDLACLDSQETLCLDRSSAIGEWWDIVRACTMSHIHSGGTVAYSGISRSVQSIVRTYKSNCSPVVS